MSSWPEIREVIERYLRYPSDWRVESAAGMNVTEALGVGVERLTLVHPARRCDVDVTTLQAGFTTNPVSLGGSAEAFPSGWTNRVYRGPMFTLDVLDAQDFNGGVRTATLNWTLATGGNITIYVFGSASLATSLMLTGAPPLSLAAVLGMARAFAIYSSMNVGTPDTGLVFGAGYARVSHVTSP